MRAERDIVLHALRKNNNVQNRDWKSNNILVKDY